MSWSEVKKINSDLTTPLNKGGVKIVKSVQRGLFELDKRYTIIWDYTIPINEVDPEKCLVIIDDQNMAKSNNMYGKVLISLSNTEFTINAAADSSNGTRISWQLIEFY